MCRVIAIANQKGGVGKTNVTVNLGIGLAKRGKNVLLVDADPQGSLSISLGNANPDIMDNTLSSMLAEMLSDDSINKNGIRNHAEGVDYIPANIELSDFDVSLVNIMSRELVLRHYLDSIKNEYDYVIIDCMPSLGMITVNVLACADDVIIPVESEYLSLKGLQQLTTTIYKVKRQLNRKLEILGILVTKTDKVTNLSRSILEAIHNTYAGDVRVFNAEIPLDVKAKEACLRGSSIWNSAPKCRAAEAYTKLVDEVISYEE